MKKRICKYLLFTLCSVLIINTIVFYLVDELYTSKHAKSHQALAGNLQVKQRFYLNHTDRYDLIFYGDSRSFCAFDCNILDTILDTRCINLSHWANWFPNQLPYLEDMLDSIPPSATLVWSIGHQNFETRVGKIKLTYPVGFTNSMRYLKWGYTYDEVRDNLLYSLPFTYTFGANEIITPQIQEAYDMVLVRKTPAQMSRESTRELNRTAYESILSTLDKKHNLLINPVLNNDTISSVEILRNGGSYMRIEIDTSFFRRMQRSLGARYHRADPNTAFSPEEKYLRSFEAILDLCSRKKINLVVNEFEEAPFVYPDPGTKEHYRNFMKQVETKVLQRNFRYIRINWNEFRNEDYFDYNHLNKDGILKFSTLFSQKFKALNP